MNKILVLAVCVIYLALSRADEIDNSYQCHGLSEYNAATKGEVTSPFFYERDRYHDGLRCKYRIRAPKGHRIKISFKAFNISCPEDELVVYSKYAKSVLGRFCGTEIPRPLLSLPGESEIRLRFRTDDTVSGKGFAMIYESGLNLELCDAGLKKCKNRNCYDPKKKCDGVDDCGDGTDEEDCGFPLVVEPGLCGTPVFEPYTIFNQSSPDRMVGGDIAVPNSWPWQVSLQRKLKEPHGHFCGGTLINAQWVVTAAHCMKDFDNPQDLRIVLGSHYKYKRTKYVQIRTAVKIISYPDLEGDHLMFFTKNDDISLIKLNAPVKFNDGVQPACIPSLGWTAKPGWHCYVSGWGQTKGSGGADVLKQQEQIVLSEQACRFNKKTQICIAKYQQSPCHGDSGGPLQCKVEGKWFVFGAASYITDVKKGVCAGPKVKAVYSSVADKSDWIKNLVNEYS